MKMWLHFCAKSWPRRMWGVVSLPADDLGPRAWSVMLWRIHFGIDWQQNSKSAQVKDGEQ